MTKPIGLAKQAYVGPPKPTTSTPLGNDNFELPSKEPKWDFKKKSVRRKEIIDNL